MEQLLHELLHEDLKGRCLADDELDDEVEGVAALGLCEELPSIALRLLEDGDLEYDDSAELRRFELKAIVFPDHARAILGVRRP